MNLNQVTVPSTDVERAVQFYKKLGLKLIVMTHPGYARFECPVGDATFSIHQVEALPKGDGAYVYFEVKNVSEKVKELLEKGVHFEEMPSVKSWLWEEARLRDPDGNQIIIFHAGNNRKNPPWRIKD